MVAGLLSFVLCSARYALLASLLFAVGSRIHFRAVHHGSFTVADRPVAVWICIYNCRLPLLVYIVLALAVMNGVDTFF